MPSIRGRLHEGARVKHAVTIRHRHRALAWPVAMAVMVLVSPRTASADLAPKWTDAQLVRFADAIVRGRVTAVTVAIDDRVGTPYTLVSLDVSEVLKGEIRGRQITLKQLGGRIGSTALQIAGQPEFSVGEEVRVFLEARPRDRSLTVTALWQGKFTILEGSSESPQAVRRDPQGSASGVFGGDVRSLTAWETALRREIATATTGPSESGRYLTFDLSP